MKLKREFLESIVSIQSIDADRTAMWRELIKNDLKGKADVKFIRNIYLDRFKLKEYDGGDDSVMDFHFKMKTLCAQASYLNLTIVFEKAESHGKK